MLYMIGHHQTTCFLTPKSLVMFVLLQRVCLEVKFAVNIIGPSTHVRDLGVSMSSNCTFDFHISNLYKRCSNLAGWILRTFTIRDPQVMLTLYKSLVMSRLEYASQLWSPYLLKHVYLIEKFQSFHQTYLRNVLSFLQ